MSQVPAYFELCSSAATEVSAVIVWQDLKQDSGQDSPLQTCGIEILCVQKSEVQGWINNAGSRWITEQAGSRSNLASPSELSMIVLLVAQNFPPR